MKKKLYISVAKKAANTTTTTLWLVNSDNGVSIVDSPCGKKVARVILRHSRFLVGTWEENVRRFCEIAESRLIKRGLVRIYDDLGLMCLTTKGEEFFKS